MKATVGIITHNRAGIISKCLAGLKIQTVKPEKIIIVDTSDNRDTEAVVKKHRMPIKYIHLKKRVRQPAARNIVLRETKTEILAFLDDDAVPKKEWLKNIVKGYSLGGKIAAVCGPAVNCNLELKPIIKYRYTDKIQNKINSVGDVRFYPAWIPSGPKECSSMIGANMSFLTEKLREAGGFVEFYSEGYGFREENFPQAVLVKKGYRFIYMPEAFVWHIKVREGGAEKFKDHFYLCGKNHRHFADNFFPKWKTRLSWIFWSVSPPCLWLCIGMALTRRDLSILRWHKGLWGF
jgi:GT2 family glycosyltransferase